MEPAKADSQQISDWDSIQDNDGDDGGFCDNSKPTARRAEESVSPIAGDRGGSIDRGHIKYHPKSQDHLLKAKDYNPLPTQVPPPIPALAGNIGERHVLVLIGLPCRGKSFTAGRLARYLKFFHGADCRMFNVSDRKFRVEDDRLSKAEQTEQNAVKLREHLFEFLSREDQCSSRNMKNVEDTTEDPRKKNVDSGRVAILYSTDAFDSFAERWSGTSKERRRWICEEVECFTKVRVKLVFLEIIVNDGKVADSNILRRISHARDTNPDLDIEEEKARWERMILQYQRRYVTMQEDGSEDDLSYIKLINYGEKVITNKMHGYLPMRIVQFLSNIHTKPHSIYLTRHGQSEYNVLGKIGGNPPLTPPGSAYAIRLAKFTEEHICKDENGETVKARLWTSSLQRTILTASHIPHPVFEDGWQQMAPRVYRNLDEIFAGEYEGMTYREIEARHGTEASLRKLDKIGYRYPRGESYFDLIARLDALVHEMESYKEPLLIVAHQAVLRIIVAYLKGIDRDMAPKQEIPLHTVMKLTYDGWQTCTAEEHYLGPEVDKLQEQQQLL